MAFEFKHHYTDSLYESDDEGNPINNNHLQKIYYTGISPYITVVNSIIIGFENNKCKYKKIFYMIKNNTSNSIRLIDIYQQIDKQYDEHRDILEIDRHHTFIEGIDIINEITFELFCGS